MDLSNKELEVIEKSIEDIQVVDIDNGEISSKYRGTAADKRDMIMLGKKQVLRVCSLKKRILSSFLCLV